MPQEATNAQALYKGLLSLAVYRRVLQRPVTSLLAGMLRACLKGDEDTVCSNYGELCSLLIRDGRPEGLAFAVAREVLSDENAFTIELAKGARGFVPDELLALAKRDLNILYRAATSSVELAASHLPAAFEGLPPLYEGPHDNSYPLTGRWDECIGRLGEYHRKNGVGIFTLHNAFLWYNHDITPIIHPDPTRLNELKNYEEQRRVAIDNTLAFLDRYPANNMLLYGDRGTGKSSTVKGLLNEYADRGLRMIEMPKETLSQLPELTSRLARIPMRFIVFIDDLSFSGSDDNFAALKAVLEGGLASRPENVLIYATSNRRHLLRESFSDRSGDEVHHADTVQESVSLSDRFGIFLTFLMPDKRGFFDIVEQLAADYRLDIEREALLRGAEQWALERGGRSPRFARQYIDDLRARLKHDC